MTLGFNVVHFVVLKDLPLRLKPSSDTIMAIMLDRMRWPGHVARMGGLRNAKKVKW